MNTNQIIKFNNQQIPVFFHNDKPYVAIKPICENIGLDWVSQHKRILRNHVLSQGMVMMTIPSKGGNQETITLPIGYLNGWLFGIDVNRVKPEIKPTLIKYQLECFDVLYKHFMPKVAEVHPNTITIEQQQQIKDAVINKCHREGKHYQAVYRDFYIHFGIPRYQELPISKFNEALVWLNDGFAQTKQNPHFETHAYNAASHLLWVSAWWRCFGDSIRMLNPTMASRIHDHFADGAFSASLTLGSERSKELGKRIQQDYPYMLRQCDLIDFFRCS